MGHGAFVSRCFPAGKRRGKWRQQLGSGVPVMNRTGQNRSLFW